MKHINTQQSYRMSASDAEVTVGCKSLHPHGFRGGKMKIYFFIFSFCKNVDQKKNTLVASFFFMYFYAAKVGLKNINIDMFFFQFIII